MDNILEYSEEVIDRFIRSMGYDPRHIDRDKRMAFTKTIRFQQFAQRMEEVELDEGCGCPVRKKEMSKSARIIKSIYKKKRMIKDELYDWEKDDKGADEKGATAVLKGGKTMTGQSRDTVLIDPVIKKPRPGSPNSDESQFNK